MIQSLAVTSAHFAEEQDTGISRTIASDSSNHNETHAIGKNTHWALFEKGHTHPEGVLCMLSATFATASSRVSLSGLVLVVQFLGALHALLLVEISRSPCSSALLSVLGALCVASCNVTSLTPKTTTPEIVHSGFSRVNHALPDALSRHRSLCSLTSALICACCMLLSNLRLLNRESSVHQCLV